MAVEGEEEIVSLQDKEGEQQQQKEEATADGEQGEHRTAYLKNIPFSADADEVRAFVVSGIVSRRRARQAQEKGEGDEKKKPFSSLVVVESVDVKMRAPSEKDGRRLPAGWALVTFGSAAEMLESLELSGTEFFGSGREVVIEVARPRAPSARLAPGGLTISEKARRDDVQQRRQELVESSLRLTFQRSVEEDELGAVIAERVAGMLGASSPSVRFVKKGLAFIDCSSAPAAAAIFENLTANPLELRGKAVKAAIAKRQVPDGAPEPEIARPNAARRRKVGEDGDGTAAAEGETSGPPDAAPAPRTTGKRARHG
jgi:hypothetical protein